jgi:hypothetical protein
MNEMQLLERMWDDVEADPVALRRTRRRLLRHALARKPRPRVRLRRALVGGSVAAAVAIGVMVTNGTPGTVGSQAAAAAVLDRAAYVSGLQVVGPSQWTHIRTETTRDGQSGTSVQEAWVPGDSTGDVRLLDSDGLVRVQTMHVPDIATDPNATDDDVYTWLRRDNGDLKGAAAAFERATETLAAFDTPAEFRTRLFAAIEKIDGVRVVHESAEFAGHDAVVLGRSDGGYETQLVFDKDSGAFIGYQGVSSGAGQPGGYQTAVTTDVVNSLPPRAVS